MLPPADDVAVTRLRRRRATSFKFGLHRAEVFAHSLRRCKRADCFSSISDSESSSRTCCFHGFFSTSFAAPRRLRRQATQPKMRTQMNSARQTAKIGIYVERSSFRPVRFQPGGSLAVMSVDVDGTLDEESEGNWVGSAWSSTSGITPVFSGCRSLSVAQSQYVEPYSVQLSSFRQRPSSPCTYLSGTCGAAAPTRLTRLGIDEYPKNSLACSSSVTSASVRRDEDGRSGTKRVLRYGQRKSGGGGSDDRGRPSAVDEEAATVANSAIRFEEGRGGGLF